MLKNICDPFSGIIHEKGTMITFEFGGISGTLPRDQKQVLQKEGNLYMAP
jgi:hypothetical protein